MKSWTLLSREGLTHWLNTCFPPRLSQHGRSFPGVSCTRQTLNSSEAESTVCIWQCREWYCLSRGCSSLSWLAFTIFTAISMSPSAFNQERGTFNKRTASHTCVIVLVFDQTSSSAIFCFSSFSVRMSGGVFTLENNVGRQTLVILEALFFF